MEALIRSIGRIPRQRTTLYGDAPAEQQRRSFTAAPLAQVEQTPAAAGWLPPDRCRSPLPAAERLQQRESLKL
jgi:hypothetical protein